MRDNRAPFPASTSAPRPARRQLLGAAAAFGLTGMLPACSDSAARSIDTNTLLTASQALAQALGAVPQPETGLQALDQALAQTVGHKLFTVLVLNWEKKENQRYYSNQPQAYPVGGSKPIVEAGWFYEQVIVAGQPQIQRNADDIVRAFPDHELILSLGCESAINYPLRFAGRTIGSLNLLHEAGWYTELDEPALQLFAGLAMPLVMEIVRVQN